MARETQEEPQAPQNDGQYQAAQEQPQVSGADLEKAVAERDERIAALKAQVADAAKNAEAAEAAARRDRRAKAQGESDRIDPQLQFAGVRNVKAARAILADCGGDVDALKEAEPWLFADAPPSSRAGGPGSPTPGPAQPPARP